VFTDVLLCAAGLSAIIAPPAVIIVLLWMRTRRRETQTTNTWIELATKLGLSYEQKKYPGLPFTGIINGEYRGRGIFLHHVRQFLLFGDEKRFYRIWVGVNMNPHGRLSLRRRSHLDRLTTKTVKIGDSKFDERFTIKADTDDAARTIFSSSFLRQKLINGPPLSFNLLKDRVESVFPQIAHNSDHWHSIIDILCDVAEAVEG